MSKISTPPSNQELFWATIEHAQGWIAEDGPLLTRLRAMEGRFDGPLLRQIGSAYNVSRWIIRERSPDGRMIVDDRGASALAELLNAYQGRWSENLLDRAEQCLEIACEAQRCKLTKNLQASAATKFSWFARPRAWTVFDRYAANGMALKPSSTKCKVREFYARLKTGGFIEHSETIQAIIDRVFPGELHGTRIIDKLIMRRGNQAEWLRLTQPHCVGFLAGLPSIWREQVVHLAAQIQATLSNDILR